MGKTHRPPRRPNYPLSTFRPTSRSGPSTTGPYVSWIYRKRDFGDSLIHGGGRLAPQGAPPWADAAKESRYYDELGQSFAGGQLAFAAPDRRKCDPSPNVSTGQDDIVARIVGNCPTLTYVGAGQSSWRADCLLRRDIDTFKWRSDIAGGGRAEITNTFYARPGDGPVSRGESRDIARWVVKKTIAIAYTFLRLFGLVYLFDIDGISLPVWGRWRIIGFSGNGKFQPRNTRVIRRGAEIFTGRDNFPRLDNEATRSVVIAGMGGVNPRMGILGRAAIGAS